MHDESNGYFPLGHNALGCLTDFLVIMHRHDRHLGCEKDFIFSLVDRFSVIHFNQ